MSSAGARAAVNREHGRKWQLTMFLVKTELLRSVRGRVAVSQNAGVAVAHGHTKGIGEETEIAPPKPMSPMRTVPALEPLPASPIPLWGGDREGGGEAGGEAGGRKRKERGEPWKRVGARLYERPRS